MARRARVVVRHARHGSNVVWVDPERDLVVVSRWLERGAGDERAATPDRNAVLDRLLAAV